MLTTKLTKEEVEQVTSVKSAKKIAKFFEIDIKITLFGVTIFEWHFPPLDRKEVEE